MANPVDVSDGARELVDLNAEAIGSLGSHLKIIGDILAKSEQPPQKGKKSTATRVSEKLELYKKYSAEVERRKNAIDTKIAEDFERLRLWRQEAGTEGASMVEELQAQYDKIRELNKELEAVNENLEVEKEKVEELTQTVGKKDDKIGSLIETVVCNKEIARAKYHNLEIVNILIKSTFDDVRFKWKAQEEREKLRILHHQKMRKARAQDRITIIQRERTKRLMQACFLALQEECIECRNEQHLFELRQTHDDELLILNAQIAQALGDEEQAKELVAQQVQRMEEARRQARDAERDKKKAEKETREAKAEADVARQERDAAKEAENKATARADAAEADAAEARAAEAHQKAIAAAAELARQKAEKSMRDAEDQVKKKNKKIANLQRMLAELGAESDSDAPPDERPPAFFVNEDGSKAPRPRTRKERMGMAYREAESARFELRLGMAAMIDKDINNAQQVKKVQTEMKRVMQEILEVRWANQVLAADADAAAAKIAAFTAKQTQQSGDGPINSARSSGGGVYAPLMGPPNVGLAPSTAAVPPFSPTRPHFKPPSTQDGKTSPRLLVKSSSTPMMMPEVYPEPPNKGKISLAPLRNVKRPPHEWQIGWH